MSEAPPGRRRGPRPVAYPERVVWVNGALLRGGDATLSLFDRGARDGEGLLETMRVYDGRPFQWERHMERLVLAAAELGFPVPPGSARLRDAVDQVLAAEGITDAAVRITVTRGVPGGRPTRTGAWVEAQPIAARLWSGTRSGAAAAVFSRTPFEPGPLGRYKTTSRLAYALASEEARAARVDEALLVSPSGHVLEGAASNVFAVVEGKVLTPPLARGILPGIARAATIALCEALAIPAGERDLTRDELLAADEVFLTNSLQEVAPLDRLQGRPLRSSAVGDRIRDAYRDAVLRTP
jgi:branched-subunit amino acid aminotransferase/4-amino-4-deoxychorismate lyase